MNITYKITAIAVIVLLFTACEKNEGISPSNNTSASKGSITNIDKSGDYWDGVADFIFNNMEGNPLSTMTIEKALDFTEASLDFRLTNNTVAAVEYRKMGDQLEYTVAYGGGDNITGADIEKLNSDIYSDLDDQAAANATVSEEQVIIEVVDLTWDIGATSTTVYVNALFGYALQPQKLCFDDTYDHRKAGIRQNCWSQTTNSTAFEMIDHVTRNFTCGTWDDVSNCPYKLPTDISRATISGTTGCGFSMFSGASSTCRNYNDLNTDLDNIRLAWNNNCPSIVNNNLKLRTVFVYGSFGVGGIVSYAAEYMAAKCYVKKITDPNLVKPALTWVD